MTVLVENAKEAKELSVSGMDLLARGMCLNEEVAQRWVRSRGVA